MALNEYNLTVGTDKVGVTFSQTVTAVAGGATSLGGTTAVRVLIDDAIVPSKLEAVRLQEIMEYFLTEKPWPPA